MSLLGLGIQEIAVIAVVILVVFGPQRLPELMTQMARFFVRMRQLSAEVRHTFESALYKAEQDMAAEQQRQLEDRPPKP